MRGAGCVIDAGMGELPASSDAAAAAAIPGDAMTRLTETIELPDVDIGQFAWEGALVATPRPGRAEGALKLRNLSFLARDRRDKLLRAHV